MVRRLLRLPSDDDDDDELTTAIPPNPNPNPHSTPLPDSPPLTISDDNDEDDFVDVADNLSTPSPPNPNPNPNPSENSDIDLRISTIDEFLRRLGMRIRPEFLEFCYEKICGVNNGFEAMSVDLKARKCFEQLLFADLNQIGAGILPQNVGLLHKSELEGPFVLQVDEIVNISAPIKDRYQNCPAGNKRCLKLHMTDGVTRVVGIEYRPIRELEVLAPSGFKVVIKNVQVRHGVLMLVPEIITILGGTVNYLDEARQRLVDEINKPPRGKKRSGGMTLSQRAALAAWPTNNNINNSTNSNMTAGNSQRNTDMPAGDSQRNTDMPAGNSQRNYSAIPQPERVDSQSTTGISNVVPSDVSGVTTDAIRTNRTNTANVFPNTVSGVTREKEIKPFVRGKIKCFLMGVKGFAYKDKYDLRVLIDDGSRISQIQIDQTAVEKEVGYSTEQVNSALVSSDEETRTNMMRTMKNFQFFVRQFEGTMVIEFNKSSSLPIAIEWNQGFSSSDAKLLLQRLKD
ncbi:hypothetical protein LUZ60_004848 [Juncus effusus]|nr:hypothetical protein LUZ60_004848 [Juncus effusus]